MLLLLLFGGYGTFLGLINIIDSLKINGKQPNTNNILVKIPIIIAQIAGFVLVVMQILQILKVIK